MGKVNTTGTYRQCVRCVMDSSDPDIRFNDEGICSYCQGYEVRKKIFVPEKKEAEKLLQQMVDTCRAAGKNKPYDCVIGVSGGVDSSYVAWLVHELGLRPLALHLDNGWNSEPAISNIRNLLSVLEIPLQTYVLDWEEFKQLQLAFLRASTPDSEIPSDHAIVALMRAAADKEGVPLLWGVNFSTEAILPSAWSQGHMDWTYIKNVNRIFGKGKLKSFPHYSIFTLIWYNRFRRQKVYNILNYIDYNKDEAKKLLMEKTGWKDYGGKHYESVYTRIYQSYILPVKFGFDKRKPHYSSLILAGQMSRDEAMERLAVPPYDAATVETDIQFLIKKFGISREEFDNIMQLPPKSYTDYKSSWPDYVKAADRFLFSNLIRLKKKFF